MTLDRPPRVSWRAGARPAPAGERSTYTVRFVTSVSKADVGLSAPYGQPAPMTPALRRAALTVARERALDSFPNAHLCEIKIVEVKEYSDHDTSAATVTLDIGGTGYGNTNEVLA